MLTLSLHNAFQDGTFAHKVDDKLQYLWNGTDSQLRCPPVLHGPNGGRSSGVEEGHQQTQSRPRRTVKTKGGISG